MPDEVASARTGELAPFSSCFSWSVTGRHCSMGPRTGIWVSCPGGQNWLSCCTVTPRLPANGPGHNAEAKALPVGPADRSAVASGMVPVNTGWLGTGKAALS